MPSHVGQIIMSTTLNTAAKVKAIYGGTWVAWGGGRVPMGVGSNGTSTYSSANATGGAEKHTLTEAQLPNITGTITMHSAASATNIHGISGHFTSSVKNSNSYKSGGDTASGAISYGNFTYSFGSGNAHNNMQPYITVYMWRRTA